MLDAYIIQRIRQERDDSRGVARVPLRIEIPQPPPEEREAERRSDDEERGITTIDFSI